MDNSILYITLLMATLIAIIIIYFFTSLMQHHRRYVKLQKDRLDAEITIQENERKRIANDLHDSIGAMLAAVKINISCINPKFADDEQLVIKSSRYIDDIITNLRRISYNLLPNTLERKGVIEALKEFVENLQKSNYLHFDIKVAEKTDIDKERGVHIFRILQEIIHNTLKHAKAKNMLIEISEVKGSLLIVTKDDGEGFDESVKSAESSGLGLKSIKSRTEMLNGRMKLQTAFKKGTMYIIEIPV